MKKNIALFCLFCLFINSFFSQQIIKEDDYITVLTTDLDSINRLKSSKGELIFDQSVSRQIKDRIESNIKTYTKFRITDPSSYLANYSIISYIDYVNSVYILSLSMISFSTGEILFNVQSSGRKTLEDIFVSTPSAIDEATILFCKQLNIEVSLDKKNGIKPKKEAKSKEDVASNKKTSTVWSLFSLSAEPLFGMKYGQLDEYVFLKQTQYSEDKLSELNWKIKPELQYGIKIRGGWNGFFEETHFTAGIPMDCGKMTDSDWMNIKYANQENSLYKTNYSESDNHLDYDISFGFKGGYEFRFFEIISIKPALAFEYQNTKFTGKNGTAWYGKSKYPSGKYPYDDTDHQETHDFSGKRVVGYNRISDIIWLGSDFAVSLSPNFEINAGFFLSPYTYTVSFDNHLLTSMDYADKTIDSFSAFRWNFGVSYRIAERHFINLNASYFYMSLIRGETYEKSSSQSTYTKSTVAEGGAGAGWFDLTLSYRFKIF